MPKVSIYVPDTMYRAIKSRNLSMSHIAQDAFAKALTADTNADWIKSARKRATKATAISTERLMASIDDDFAC